MKKHAIKLYGREYAVSCEPEEIARLEEIVELVSATMKKVTGRAGVPTESRLMLLTCLQLADELLEIRQTGERLALEKEDLLLGAVEQLKQRVAALQKAC